MEQGLKKFFTQDSALSIGVVGALCCQVIRKVWFLKIWFRFRDRSSSFPRYCCYWLVKLVWAVLKESHLTLFMVYFQLILSWVGLDWRCTTTIPFLDKKLVRTGFLLRLTHLLSIFKLLNRFNIHMDWQLDYNCEF